jgi:hypothetical protein
MLVPGALVGRFRFRNFFPGQITSYFIQILLTRVGLALQETKSRRSVV